MDQFFHFFARQRVFPVLLTLSIFGIGLATLTQTQRSQFPKVDLGEITITTPFPGASPEDVELNVTNKIEKELKGIVGIDRYISRSEENLSFIHVFLDADLDNISDVKTEIREAIGRIGDFPEELDETPIIQEVKTSVFPVIEVGISGEVDYSFLRTYVKELSSKLKTLSGVARIEEIGLLDREIKIEVDPAKLKEHHIGIVEIIRAIQSQNLRSSGGHIESFTSEKNILTISQFRDPFEVEDVIIRSNLDRQIRVKDVAQVVDGYEKALITSRMNGKDAISLAVIKSEKADVIRTVKLVHELIDKERVRQKGKVDFKFTRDRAQEIGNQFDIVKNNGIIGLAFLGIVLACFLNWRVAGWVALGIPIAILGTIMLLPFAGLDLDTVSLTAMVIVIGIVVDDAIIIAESIYREYENGLEPVDAAVKGLRNVLRPVLTTVVTTVFAFLPLLFLDGILGKFTWVVPLVICLALLVSIIEALLALPAHLAHSLEKQTKKTPIQQTKSPFSSIRKGFERFLKSAIRFRYVCFLVACLTLGTAILASLQMDFSLFPSKGANEFLITAKMPAGNSTEATTAKLSEIEAELQALPDDELQSYALRIGAFVDVFSVQRENFATFVVSLTPYSNRSRTADEIVAELRKKTDTFSGFEEITYIIRAGGPPIGEPVDVRIVGYPDSDRDTVANLVLAKLKSLPGVFDVVRDELTGKENLEVVVDHEELKRHGLTVADVAQNIRFAYDGQVATSVRYGDEDVNFRVQLSKDFRSRPDEVSNLLIPNIFGELIPLNRVAKTIPTKAPAAYYHYNGDRSIGVKANIDDSKTTPYKIVRELTASVSLEEFPGVRLIVGGEAKNSVDAIEDLSYKFSIAVVGIAIILILLFNSFLQPFYVLLAVPFGFIGVIFAFITHGEPFSFLAATGGIGLVGVVVNDSLVLVNHVNSTRKNNPQMQLIDAVTLAAGDRLRPILLTTASTVVGLLPLVYGLGGADVYMGPMAMALGYGLLFATPLTLVLLPCIYIIGEDLRNLIGINKKGPKHPPKPEAESIHEPEQDVA